MSAIARAYAGHTGKNDAGTTSTYVQAQIEEIALALAALVGEPHPLATAANDTSNGASAGRSRQHPASVQVTTSRPLA